jgi:hypothetical protein
MQSITRQGNARLDQARLGKAGTAWQSVSSRGAAERGAVWLCAARLAVQGWRGGARPGTVWHCRAWRVAARRGAAGPGKAGEACRGFAQRGAARHRAVRLGLARPSMAWLAWRVWARRSRACLAMAKPCKAWHGWRGMAELCMAQQCKAWSVTAGNARLVAAMRGASGQRGAWLSWRGPAGRRSACRLLVRVGQREAWLALPVTVGRCNAPQSAAEHGTAGAASPNYARRGGAWRGWLGPAGVGPPLQRQSTARLAWHSQSRWSVARLCAARHGWLGGATPVPAWLGSAWPSHAKRGTAGSARQVLSRGRSMPCFAGQDPVGLGSAVDANGHGPALRCGTVAPVRIITKEAQP